MRFYLNISKVSVKSNTAKIHVHTPVKGMAIVKMPDILMLQHFIGESVLS